MSRSVVDQYGTMEWEITFILNPGETPAGAGDIAALSVIQNFAMVSGSVSQPVVIETQKGSMGLSGTFGLNYNDVAGMR